MSDVAVIGAGVSGLAAALRLSRLGHRVTILEAKSHAGGLSQTVRTGSVLTERDNDGTLIQQTCTLPPHCYVNAGPGRLPHHHRRIIALCHELGVELEPYTMSSDANFYLHRGSRTTYRRRRIEHDSRGWIAEHALSGTSGARRRAMVRAFGDLDRDGQYLGTARAGDGEPISFEALARMRHWEFLFHQPMSYLWQDSMFQPAGGMDNVWRALLAALADEQRVRIVYNAPVRAVRTRATNVRLHWTQSGVPRTGTFDWCASTIHLPQLAEHVEMHGFSDSYRSAVATPRFAEACKVGWYSTSRWWENDEYQCFGGISYTDHIIAQFWYPSYDYFSGDGTLTGCYNAYDGARRFGRLNHGERVRIARQGGALLHPEIDDEDTVPGDRAISVAWHRVPYQSGGWCSWNPETPGHDEAYNRLLEPDGRYIAIGDQVSPWPGWKEGALHAAYRAVDIIEDRHVAAREYEPVPDSYWLTQGDHPAGTFDETTMSAVS